MSRISRLLVFIAAVFILTTFFTPLWEISIYAPQYPEGLFMQIWTTKITGDVRNINILNHYIGMKHIDAADFQELVWFSKIFGGLAAGGLLVAALGRRLLATLWTGGFLSFGLWAFYDFWKWEYTFGHHLNPDAPIKVDGMSYAPPLIGSKELLNITASSWPGLGGWAVGIAIALAVAAFWWDLKKRKPIGPIAALIGMLSLGGCFSTRAEPVIFGKDSCHTCQMTISDRRFGAEWVSEKGKSHKFDSLECLAEFLEKNPSSADRGKIYVVDAGKDGKLIPLDRASFILRDDLRSPMGRGYFASESVKDLQAVAGTSSLKLLEWSEILAAIKGNKS